MKKNELEQLVVDFRQKVDEINSKIRTVEDLESKLNSLNQNLQTSEDVKSKIDNINNSASELLAAIKTKKEETDQAKTVVDSAVAVSSGYQETINKQTKSWDENKEKFDKLIKENEDLQETIKNQLGLVSLEILANSFYEEAKNLKVVKDKWFKWLVGLVAVLFVTVIIIAWVQYIEHKTLFEINFLIKIPLISPLVYFIVFVARQYSRDRRLHDEYVFKATVAKSFEAYRKVIGDETKDLTPDDQNKLLEKKFNFVISSISDIYSSPTDKLNNEKDEGNDKDDIGLISKITSVAEEVFKRMMPK